MASMLTAALLLSSCIKDEAPNAEADILTCSLSGDLLIRKPTITNDKVVLYVNGWVDLTSLAPAFTLTDGATIDPASGTARDFSTPQTYQVTSQDGKWSKVYSVQFVKDGIATQFSFENIRYFVKSGKNAYQIFYSTRSDGSEMEWGSGNAGFMITNGDAAPADYPTSQSDEGYIGKCAKLTTVSTGSLGIMFKAPIAAGNLFVGTFAVNLSDMEKSTHFGVPFGHVPTHLCGYYKYSPGPVFTDKDNKVIEGRNDDFDIYGIFYEVTKDVPYLDGSNALTSDNIVAVARLENRQKTENWTWFDIPFQLKEGKTIEAAKLANLQYNVSIVMSSSRGGGPFEGAAGSTLMVDELELFYLND